MSAASPSPPPSPPTSLVVHTVLRLPPDAPLYSSLLDAFAVLQSRSDLGPLGGLFVVTCVGSVHGVSLRLSNAARVGSSGPNNDVLTFAPARKFEILSLVGTISGEGEAHLHVSLGDHEGRVWGGHLLSAKVLTTAEVVLGLLLREGGSRAALSLERRFDPQTGFKELVVVPSLGSSSPQRWVPAQYPSWAALATAALAGGALVLLGVGAALACKLGPGPGLLKGASGTERRRGS